MHGYNYNKVLDRLIEGKVNGQEQSAYASLYMMTLKMDLVLCFYFQMTQKDSFSF